MRRFSTPVSETLFRSFDKAVPDGIKATVIRSLVGILLASDDKTIWDVAQNEEHPERFELRRKI